MALSNHVTKLNSSLDNSIDQFDIPSYKELSHPFNELNGDITSLSLKNKALKLTVSPY